MTQPDTLFADPLDPATRRQLTILVLLVANLVPLVGVLFFGWDLRSVMLLYWAENVVVGIYTILRMAVVGGARAVALVPFFCVHYGMFMFVHLMFVLALTSGIIGGSAPPGALNPTDAPHYLLSIPLLGLVALFVSHGISFVFHFLLGAERKTSTVQTEMMRPYPRIAVLHVAIIIGAVPVTFLGSPIGLLAVLVLLKIGLDVIAHRREHQVMRQPGPPPTAGPI